MLYTCIELSNVYNHRQVTGSLLRRLNEIINSPPWPAAELDEPGEMAFKLAGESAKALKKIPTATDSSHHSYFAQVLVNRDYFG